MEGSESRSSGPAAGPVSSVAVPVVSGMHSEALWAGVILATWFDATLDIFVDDPAAADDLGATVRSLGLRSSQVVMCEGNVVADLVARFTADAAPLVVLPRTTAGLDLAAVLPGTKYLLGPGMHHRLPSGPIVVPLKLDGSDVSALALASVLAVHLDTQIRLITPTSTTTAEDAALVDVSDRIRAMSIDVAIDAVSDVNHDAASIAATRSATALILQPDESLEADDAFDVPVVIPGFGRWSSNPITAATDTPSDSALEVIDQQESLKLLETESLARLAYIDNGWPTVVPVNYRSVDASIFIRSLPGQKMRAAQRKDVVCLEVDRTDKWARTGWSVVVHGTLEVIEDASELELAWANDPEPWAKSQTFTWLRLAPVTIGGRRIRG